MKQIFRYENNWILFLIQPARLSLIYNVAGYFDERPNIHLALFFFELYINLPFKSGIDDCESLSYGFYLYGIGLHPLWFDQLWIRLGTKSKVIEMPWAFDWVRTSNLRTDGSWEHETRKNRKDFYEEKWKGIIWNETVPFSYKLKSGEKQNVLATIKVEEREWRPQWFKWTKLFAKTRKTIDIDFDGEVGERAGSSKGGTVGCSYEIIGSETPLECLRRMEVERKFT